MSAIDADQKLSASGKADEKRKSPKRQSLRWKIEALTKARDAVERKLTEWNKQLTPSPGDAAINAEIRAH